MIFSDKLNRMTMNEYQASAHETSHNIKIGGETLLYPVLGLAGESGELANKVKKIYRDDVGVLSDVRRDEIADELSDCLWYLAEIATQLNFDLNDIAAGNLHKLADRASRGVIGGSGDER